MTDPKRPPLDEAAREEMRQACEAMERTTGTAMLRNAQEAWEAHVTPERVLALLDELVTPDEAAAIQRVAEVEELRRALEIERTARLAAEDAHRTAWDAAIDEAIPAALRAEGEGRSVVAALQALKSTHRQ